MAKKAKARETKGPCSGGVSTQESTSQTGGDLSYDYCRIDLLETVTDGNGNCLFKRFQITDCNLAVAVYEDCVGCPSDCDFDPDACDDPRDTVCSYYSFAQSQHGAMGPPSPEVWIRDHLGRPVLQRFNPAAYVGKDLGDLQPGACQSGALQCCVEFDIDGVKQNAMVRLVQLSCPRSVKDHIVAIGTHVPVEPDRSTIPGETSVVYQWPTGRAAKLVFQYANRTRECVIVLLGP